MLYIVSTPIGNLGDITYRAVEILKKCHFILAEDTRESAKLLKKYDIHTQMVSYRDQNHERVVEKVIEKLKLGLDLALVSDAGTPTISDPGYRLVEAIRKQGFQVISIPGASAAISAISISGLPTDKFVFLGFLPKSESKRLSLLEEYMEKDLSVIVYESPNRVVSLLTQISTIDPQRNVFIANDMTKMFEENKLGTAEDLLAEYQNGKQKGEFVIVISKK